MPQLLEPRGYLTSLYTMRLSIVSTIGRALPVVYRSRIVVLVVVHTANTITTYYYSCFTAITEGHN